MPKSVLTQLRQSTGEARKKLEEIEAISRRRDAAVPPGPDVDREDRLMEEFSKLEDEEDLEDLKKRMGLTPQEPKKQAPEVCVRISSNIKPK